MVKAVKDPVLDLDTGRDLDSFWADMLTEYQAITKETILPIGQNQTYDNLVAQVQRNVDTMRTGNKSRAKDVLNKTAIVIKKFGGIVATAASVMFGPAGQCYNAITFVLDAGKKYADVIDGYITLLEHCAAFLERIVFHLESKRSEGEDRLDQHLRRPAYQGLGLFLTVQAHCRNYVCSKRTKMKMFCGVVLFDDDDGVKSNLGKLTRLSRELTDCTTDQILEDVKGVARYLQVSDAEREKHEAECLKHFEAIKEIKEDVERVVKTTETTGTLVGQLVASKDDKENVKRIRGAINIGESDRKWEEQHKAIRKLPGTGKWMLTSDPFTLWADPKETDDKLIMLKGNEGFGKTHLCSHVIDHMTEISVRKTNEHVHVAYYFYEKGDSADACISALVYQLAARDRAYASRAATLCPQSGFLGSASKIWETLVVGLADALKGHYFLVIDGYPGDNEGTIMKDLINHTIIAGKISMHLFISGRSDDLESLPDEGQTFSLGAPKLRRQPTRSLSNFGPDGDDTAPPASSLANYDDLLGYTKQRIDELCKKNGDLRSILQDPERDIAGIFARGTRGDFAGLARKLTELAEAQSPSTIEELIRRVGETRQESFDRVLQALYDTLTPEEIKELNILLPWIYQGKDLSEQLLRNVVHWQTNEPCWLKIHIQTKFKPFLEIDNRGMVSAAFTADDVRAATPDYSGIKPSQALSTEVRVGGKIQKCEVDLVQHFVRTYCSPELYARFQFDDFFRAKSSESSESIQLDTPNHIEAGILQTCLEALGQKTTDATFKPLRDYAALMLSDHLVEIDPYEVGKQELLHLGEALSVILWDDEAIDSWWSWANSYRLRWQWLSDDDNMKKLVKLLEHPHVAAAYSSDSERAKGIKAMMESEGRESRIFAKIAKRLAHRWLHAFDLDTQFLACSYSIVAKNKSKDEDFDIWTTPSINEIEEFVRYAQDTSTVAIDDIQLKTRKATALWWYDYNKEAIAVCAETKVETGADGYWPLLLLRARIHREAKEFAEALDCIHTMLATNEVSDAADDEFTKSYWVEGLLLEGDCHRVLKQTDQAAQCYLKLLAHGIQSEEQESTLHQAVIGLFETWAASEDHLRIVNHVERWKDLKADDGSSDEVKQDMLYWFRRFAHDARFHSHLSLAVARTETQEAIGALYDDIIKRLNKDTSKDENKDYAEMLSYHRACILLYCSPSVSDRERGLEMMVQTVVAPVEDGEFNWQAYVCVSQLAPTLLDRGIAFHAEVKKASEEQSAAAKVKRDDVLKTLNDIATQQSAAMNYRRQVPDTDPRLNLARFKLTIGDERGFRRIIMDLLHKQFDNWPKVKDVDDVSERFKRLAHILGATDEDQDTIAAWRLVNMPGIEKPAAKVPSTSSPDAAPSEKQSEGVKAESLDNKAPVAPETAKDDPATGDQVPPQAVTSTPMGDGAPAADTEVETKPSTDLIFGAVSTYSCDGACDISWDVIEDFYACKHCFDKQFCAPCYAKLTAGQLSPVLCNPKHEFVYVPAFDRAAWAALGPEKMFLGDQVIARSAWLEQLRAKWELRQDQIDARRTRIRAMLRKTLRSCVKSAAPDSRTKVVLERWKEYRREDYKDDLRHIAQVDGVYQWVADSA